jgi:peptide chain release factor 1
MGLGDVVDEFLNQHGLSDTGTAEETNFTATGIGGKEIDDLDAGFEDLGGGGLVDEWRGIGVDGAELDALDGTTLVDRLTNNVHDTAEGSAADGNENGGAGIDDLLATNKTFCTVHGNGADSVLTQVGRDLENEPAAREILDLEGVQNGGEILCLELDVNDSTDDGFYRADDGLRLRRIGAS